MKIKIDIKIHEGTGLIMAVSDDLKGLYVHGRTLAEIDARLPEAIRSILEAKGGHVNRVVHIVPERPTPGFVEPSEAMRERLYSAEMCAA